MFKYKGTVEQASQEDILAELQLASKRDPQISGIYVQDKHDENYRDYLVAMKIPSLVVGGLLSFNEVHNITAPVAADGTWVWQSETSACTS